MFADIVDKLWDSGRDIGQHILQIQSNTKNNMANSLPSTKRYSGDKVRRTKNDKIIWIVITTCNILFAIFLLQYKAPAEPCIKNSLRANPIILAKDSNDTQLPFYLARSQSFGFFYDVTNDHWRLWQEIYNDHDDHRYPDKPLTYNPESTQDTADPVMWSRRNNWPSGYFSYQAWWQNNYEPNFSCPHEKRVGVPMNGEQVL